MKTDVCYMNAKGSGRREALNEVERCARYCGLQDRQALQLRLLAEELLGAVGEIVGKHCAEFWVEENAGLFELHLTAQGEIEHDTRRELLSVSTTGKNAVKGIMGKVQAVFERFLDAYEDLGIDMQNLPCGEMEPFISGGYMPGTGDIMQWSLHQYMQSVSEDMEGAADEWDELEKSIVAKLADDVTVGVRNNQAEIVVKKYFGKH